MRYVVMFAFAFAAWRAVGMDDGRVLEAILELPDTLRYPGSQAVMEIEKGADLVEVLSRKWASCGPKDQAKVLSFVVNLANAKVASRQQYYRVSDAKVVKALVEALDSAMPEVRACAASLLASDIDEGALRSVGADIVRLVGKHGNVDGILLLGRTGRQDARELLSTDRRFLSYSKDAVQLALAKLGDADAEAELIRAFENAKDPRDKHRCADSLGYVGFDRAVRALAAELRTPEEIRYGALYSLRVFIISALSRACPKEEVLWKPQEQEQPKDDAYYEQVENWAVRKCGTVWKHPRPRFFYTMAMPGRPVP